MKNDKQTTGTAPGRPEENKEQKADVTKLPLMEMYAVLGLELGKRIFEKLQEIDASIELIATEMERQEQERKAHKAPVE